MRCDVNVSVKEKEQQEFGTRVEIKNMNSFSAMQKAIEYEIDRQAGFMRPFMTGRSSPHNPCTGIALQYKGALQI